MFLYLRETISKWTEKVLIFYLEFNCFQFCSLVKAARKVDTLEIKWCKINTDFEWNFGEMRDSKIRILNFKSTGHKNFSNWNDNQHRLENIIIGIDRCENFRNSLNEIILSYDEIEANNDYLRELLERYPRLRHIQFTLNQ